MPPPLPPPASLPERVLFVTSTVPPMLEMAAPFTDAGNPVVKRTPPLSEKVLFATLTVPGPLLEMPPPFLDLLPEKVPFVTFTVPLLFEMPPPVAEEEKATLLEKVPLVTLTVPPSL